MLTTFGEPKTLHHTLPGTINKDLSAIINFATSPCHHFIAAIKPHHLIIFHNGHQRLKLAHISRHERTWIHGPNKKVFWSRDSRNIFITTSPGYYFFVYNFHQGVTPQLKDNLDENSKYDNQPNNNKISCLLIHEITNLSSFTIELKCWISLPAACHSIIAIQKQIIAACSKQLCFYFIDQSSYNVVWVVYLNDFYERLYIPSPALLNTKFWHQNFNGANPSETGSLIFAPHHATSVIQYIKKMRHTKIDTHVLNDHFVHNSPSYPPSFETHKPVSPNIEVSQRDKSRAKSVNTFRSDHNSIFGYNNKEATGIEKIQLSQSLDLLGCLLTNGALLLLAYKSPFNYSNYKNYTASYPANDFPQHTETNKQDINKWHNRIIGISSSYISSNEPPPIGFVMKNGGVTEMEFNPSQLQLVLALENGITEIHTFPINSLDDQNPPIIRFDITKLSLYSYPHDHIYSIQWHPNGDVFKLNLKESGILLLSNTGKPVLKVPNPYRNHPTTNSVVRNDSNDIYTQISTVSGNTKELDNTQAFIISSTWTSYGYGIMLSSSLFSQPLLEYPIYQPLAPGCFIDAFHPSGIGYTTSDTNSRILIGNNQILVCIPMMDSENNLRWTPIPMPPTEYMTKNWPIRQASLNTNATFLLIAGDYRFALLDIIKQSWILMTEDHFRLRSFECPIGWYNPQIFFMCLVRSPQAEISPPIDEEEETVWKKLTKDLSKQNPGSNSDYSLYFFGAKTNNNSSLNPISMLPSLPATPIRATILSYDSHFLFIKPNDIDHFQQPNVLGILDIRLSFTAYALKELKKIDSNKQTTYHVSALWQTDFSQLNWKYYPREICFAGATSHLLVTHKNLELRAIQLIDQTNKNDPNYGGLKRYMAKESRPILSEVIQLWTSNCYQLYPFIPLVSNPIDTFDIKSTQAIEDEAPKEHNTSLHLKIPTLESPHEDLNRLNSDTEYSVGSTTSIEMQSTIPRYQQHAQLREIEESYQLYFDSDLKAFEQLHSEFQASQIPCRDFYNCDNLKNLLGGLYIWANTLDKMYLITVSFQSDGKSDYSIIPSYRILELIEFDNNGSSNFIISIVPKEGAIRISTFPSTISTYRNTRLSQLNVRSVTFLHTLLHHWIEFCFLGEKSSHYTLKSYVSHNIPKLLMNIHSQELIRNIFDVLLHNLLEKAISDFKRESHNIDSTTLSEQSNNHELKAPRIYLLEAFISENIFEFKPRETRVGYISNPVFERTQSSSVEAFNHKYYQSFGHIREYTHSEESLEHQETHIQPKQISTYNDLPSLSQIESSTHNLAMLLCFKQARSFRILYYAINLLKRFENIFPEVVINVARKSDALYAPGILFTLSGRHPHTLFQECFKSDKLDISSLIIIILQSMIGPVLVRLLYVLPLLEKCLRIYNSENSQLTNQLLRFFNALNLHTRHTTATNAEQQTVEDLFDSHYLEDYESQSSIEGDASSPSLILFSSDEDSEDEYKQNTTYEHKEDPNLEQLQNGYSEMDVKKTTQSSLYFLKSYLYSNLNSATRILLSVPYEELWRPSLIDNYSYTTNYNSWHIYEPNFLAFKLELTIQSILFEHLINLQWIKLFNIISNFKIDGYTWLRPIKDFLKSLFVVEKWNDFDIQTHKDLPAFISEAHTNQITFMHIYDFLQQCFPFTNKNDSQLKSFIEPKHFFHTKQHKEKLSLEIPNSASILRYFMLLFAHLDLNTPLLAISIFLGNNHISNYLLTNNPNLKNEVISLLNHISGSNPFSKILKRTLHIK